MADLVESVFVKFYTYMYYKTINDTHYDDDIFEFDYENNPSRMTPEQIAMVGYDYIKNKLWKDFCDKKYQELTEFIFKEKLQVVKNMGNALIKYVPNLTIEIKEGNLYNIKPYNNINDIYYPCIEIGVNMNWIKIIPTLNNDKNKCFNVIWHTDYSEEIDYCDDVELIKIAKDLRNYLVDDIKPKIN